MKATGIVRRIDDLGRVVIPKEIRRTMRIREGDPLEIFTDKDGELIFKKYSPIGELGDFAAQICDSLRKSTDSIAAVWASLLSSSVPGLPPRSATKSTLPIKSPSAITGAATVTRYLLSPWVTGSSLPPACR